MRNWTPSSAIAFLRSMTCLDSLTRDMSSRNRCGCIRQRGEMARLAVEDHEIAGYPVTKGNGRGHGHNGWCIETRDGMTRPEEFQPGALGR